MFLSEVISRDFVNWRGQSVIFDCGTGSGKTEFILSTLSNFASQNGKKILYLCNRTSLREEIEEKAAARGILKKVIYVATYQSIEQCERVGHTDYHAFDYIAADECHYFFSDARFNDYTDLSYRFLKNQMMFGDCTVILMSATCKKWFGNLVKKGLVREDFWYTIPKCYDYVSKLYFYRQDQLMSLIQGIIEEHPDEKIMVFCMAKRLKEMHSLYGKMADYYCSRNTVDKELAAICNPCIHDEQFDKHILFTTTALDNGINIKDRAVKHIFVEVFDLDVMVQCLGRKRPIDETDTVTFYLKDFGSRGVNAEFISNKQQLEMAKLYFNNPEDFQKRYAENRASYRSNRSFYTRMDVNGQFTTNINQMVYEKLVIDADLIADMKEQNYRMVVLSRLQGLEDRVGDVGEIFHTYDRMLIFLQSLEGKKLYAEDKEQIKKFFVSIGVSVRYAGINTFNGVLNDYKMKNPDFVYSKRFYNADESGERYRDRGGRRDRRYWILR